MITKPFSDYTKKKKRFVESIKTIALKKWNLSIKI